MKYFISGGQITFHAIRMATQVFKGLYLIWIVSLIAATLSWAIYKNTWRSNFTKVSFPNFFYTYF